MKSKIECHLLRNELFVKIYNFYDIFLPCKPFLVKSSHIAAFHTQGHGNQSICLSGQKILATIFVMKTQAENITDHGQTEMSNMPVKKNVLNEINKEGTFTQGFKDCRKIKRKVSQNLDDLQHLLIKLASQLTVKPAQRKRGYFMSFHLV